MHRLTVLALTLLVIIASIFTPVRARVTNADRLRRGIPPLPPSRRDIAKRSGPSPSASSTPPSVSGVLEVRDKAGSHRLGFVSNEVSGNQSINFLAVTDLNQPVSHRLQVNFSLADRNLVAINPDFHIPPPPPPLCVGPGPGPDPAASALTVFPLTIIHCPIPPLRETWFFDPTIVELTSTLLGPKGDPVPAFFAWEQSLNELKVVTTWDDVKQALPVRLFLVNPK